MLSALKKQLLQERRTSLHGLPPLGSPIATLPMVDPTEIPLPPLSPADSARLAAVAASHPRLYESLSALDTAQLAAVLSEEKSVLVRAPVGSGKTTVLVHKVLYLHLCLGVPLRQMAVLTFTNRAAAEIRTRIAALSEQALSGDDFWLTGTFHGVARALLSQVLPVEKLGYRSDFSVLDETEQEKLLEELISTHRLRIGRRSQLRQKLRQLSAGQAGPSAAVARLGQLFTLEKQRRNAMDFDDLIAHAVTLLPDPSLVADASADGDPVPLPATLLPPRWLIVDEMQDCEPRELALLARLRGAMTHFFAVGDPYQAIYGWRGSGPELFAQAEATFDCRPLVLPKNYRSTRTIVDAARAVLGIQPAAGRLPGVLSAVRSFGELLVIRRHHDPISEALYLAERIARLYQSGIPYGELAILFRLRAQADPIRAALTARNIPCSEPEEAAGDAVRLLTLHAAKGLEFQQVFLSGINEGLVPLGQRFELLGDAEERRLLFVGLTRARDRVEISYHTRPHEFCAAGEASRYLAWIPRSLVAWEDESTAASSPSSTTLDCVAAAPASEPIAPATAPTSATAGPWQPGQAVRHPRYGKGVVTCVTVGTVDCTFGKFGPRSFPNALCPLLPDEPAR